MNTSTLREYVESIIMELRKDEKFIKQLKAIKTRAKVPVEAVENMADEWFNSQRGLRDSDRKVARRLAIEKFPDLYERYGGDERSVKRALFSTLNSFLKRRTHR